MNVASISCDLINQAILNSGYKKIHIAEAIGIKPNTLYIKLAGGRKFTETEICEIAKMTKSNIRDFVEAA